MAKGKRMIDITKIPTLARDLLGGLLDREAKENGLFVDSDLPPVPDGVDPLYWRWSQGHINVQTTPIKKPETRGPDDYLPRFVDD
jgi:hypothetical protein